MPLQPTTPETREVKTVEEKTATHLHVTELRIFIDPNDSTATSIEVLWAEGYMDGETFVQIGVKRADLSGEDVLTKIGETTDGTTSVYNNVKQRVWAMLKSAGWVPAGSVT